MALRDEPLEYIKEQFDEKDMVLGQFAERVTPATFYEDIFGDMGLTVPVTILGGDERGKKIQPMELSDALEFSALRNDTLMGGCTFLNQWISRRTTQDVYALIIDLDNAYSGTLQAILQREWRNGDKEYAKPTYITNSGTGLHLYYVFDEPIPAYYKQQNALNRVYRALAKQQAQRVYVEEQLQWFGQQFRMVGGGTKYGWEVSAYRYGPRWNPDELAKFYGMDFHFIRRDEPRPEPKREPGQRKKWKRRNGWKTHRGFFDYSLAACRKQTHEGHRYMSMCALSVIAWKSGINRDELQAGLLSLMPDYNRGANRKIHEAEVESAMRTYGPRAMETPRAVLEGWVGWEYKPAIRRNRRKRPAHIQYMNGIRKLKKTIGETVNDGHPSARQTVADYMAAHPTVKNKAAIARATGVSRVTVTKYYAELRPAE